MGGEDLDFRSNSGTYMSCKRGEKVASVRTMNLYRGTEVPCVTEQYRIRIRITGIIHSRDHVSGLGAAQWIFTAPIPSR